MCFDKLDSVTLIKGIKDSIYVDFNILTIYKHTMRSKTVLKI